MATAIWSGSLSFGLVNVPVSMYSASESQKTSFHQYHAEDGGRVRQKRVCEVDGEELDLTEIARGYELPGGDVVVLTDADFQGLPLATARAILVEAFVPEEQIDPIMYSKSYYLAPDKAGVRAYALLRDALAKAGRTALVKIAIRGERERLAAVRVRDKVLVLETMFWPDEVREAVPVPESGADAAELKAARALIEEMTRDFVPEEYVNEYEVALRATVEAKAEGREVVTPPAGKMDTGAKILSLMDALKASVEAAKSSRDEPAAHPKARKKPAKKTTAARKSA